MFAGCLIRDGLVPWLYSAVMFGRVTAAGPAGLAVSQAAAAVQLR